VRKGYVVDINGAAVPTGGAESRLSNRATLNSPSTTTQ
jgi:hypothetical protein